MPTSDDLHKLRASHRQEGHLSLSRHSLGEQRLPTARGAKQQRTLRNFGTQLKEALWALEKQMCDPITGTSEINFKDWQEAQLMYHHQGAAVREVLGRAESTGSLGAPNSSHAPVRGVGLLATPMHALYTWPSSATLPGTVSAAASCSAGAHTFR